MINGIVVEDALVLEHQVITTHSIDLLPMISDHSRTNVYIWWERIKDEIPRDFLKYNQSFWITRSGHLEVVRKH